MPDRPDFYDRIRGNAEWKAIETAWRWGAPLILPTVYALYEKARHLDRDWYVIGGLLFVGILISLFGFLRSRPKKENPVTPVITPPVQISFPKKLVIHSAVYGVAGKHDIDVKDMLTSKIKGDALWLWVENGEFGSDPVHGMEKRLRVRYSFENLRIVEIERQEHDFMVLPEDSRLKSSVQVVQLVQAVPNPVDGLLAPLQIEAFTLAKELRLFNVSLGPYPIAATPDDHGTIAQDLVRYERERSVWEHKLSHGYANRDFGGKVASIFHRAGEEYGLEYPPDMLSRSAEIGPSFTSWGITKLAQEMEMIAIWINRKQRNEESLLS